MSPLIGAGRAPCRSLVRRAGTRRGPLGVPVGSEPYSRTVQGNVTRTALSLARASEELGWFRPSDWPDLAVALLLEGSEDAEVAELAGLPPTVSG